MASFPGVQAHTTPNISHPMGNLVGVSTLTEDNADAIYRAFLEGVEAPVSVSSMYSLRGSSIVVLQGDRQTSAPTMSRPPRNLTMLFSVLWAINPVLSTTKTVATCHRILRLKVTKKLFILNPSLGPGNVSLTIKKE